MNLVAIEVEGVMSSRTKKNKEEEKKENENGKSHSVHQST
jgi:hypothetical protein